MFIKDSNENIVFDTNMSTCYNNGIHLFKGLYSTKDKKMHLSNRDKIFLFNDIIYRIIDDQTAIIKIDYNYILIKIVGVNIYNTIIGRYSMFLSSNAEEYISKEINKDNILSCSLEHNSIIEFTSEINDNNIRYIHTESFTYDLFKSYFN